MLKISARDVLETADWLNITPIAVLDLPAITGNALVVAGIKTLADLARVNLDKIPGVGTQPWGGADAVRDRMAALGFTLEARAAVLFFSSRKAG